MPNSKTYEPRFITKNVTKLKRGIEPNNPFTKDSQNEVLTVEIELLGSGDTRNMKTNDILSHIFDKLKEIKL